MADTFNVMDMANEYASSNDIDVNDLFNDDVEESVEDQKTEEKVEEPKKKAWAPDASLLEGMDEMNTAPVTYSKDEIKEDEDKTLKNIVDEKTKESVVEEMDEISRITYNTETAKKRHGISKLQVPEGPFQVAIYNAACNSNFKKAQEELDRIFEEFKTTYPEFILEYVDDTKNVSEDNNEQATVNAAKTADNMPDIVQTPVSDEMDTTIIIDKSSAPTISWSPEDMEKIRKSRKIELNIVETTDLDYSSFEDIDDNAVDAVLSKYQTKVNSVECVLPASKYRCNFTGLTYQEVIDLSNSEELDNLAGERKKWSICYDHMINQSIGPWEEYKWYRDPKTKKVVKLDVTATLPADITADMVTRVSKFDDFLMKTSFLDLDFMIWKVLCATTMDNEIISIDCHAIDDKTGKVCDNTYDWVYSPSALLQLDSIEPAVLEEMEKTANAQTTEEIMENYKSSMLKTNNTVKLPSSGISVVFGHVSAYEYLNSIYGEINSLKDADQEEDVELASKGLTYGNLTVVKAFLIPTENGFKRIKGANNIIKVISTLNEIDWNVIGNLVDLMINPYRFRFAITDLVCPKCKNKSSVTIPNMEQLLFIIARSLSSVNVEFKSN